MIKLFSLMLFACTIFALEKSSSDLVERQWALNNYSQSYIRKVSELNFNNITGVDGVDINYFSEDQVSHLKGRGKIIVAVVDTGVDINHPDIVNQIWSYPGCEGKSDEEKKSLPCRGYNVLDGNGDVSDHIGHGTFVAGLLAASRDGNGIDGLLPSNIEIMPIKAITNFNGFTYKGSVVSSYIAKGVAFAVNNGAQVINLSLGLPKVIETPQVVSAIEYALSKNVIVVASAGNNNKRKNIFPCNYNGVICVGGIDIQGEKVSSSNYGQSVDIYAPGEKLIGAIPSNIESQILRIGNYDIKSGTSFAIAHVTALAAALKLKGSVRNSYDFLSLLNLSSTNYSKQASYPSVNYKKAFDIKKLVPNILTKDINGLVVGANNTLSFKFKVYNPEESYSEEVCLSSVKNILSEDKVCLNVELLSGINDISLQGALKTLDIESWQDFVIELKEAKVVKQIDIELLSPIKISKRKVISKIAAGALLRIAKNIKSSQLQKVMDFKATKEGQDYFVLNNKSLSSIFYLTETSKGHEPMQIKFSEAIKVIAVVKADMNLDGVDDIFVYGTSQKGNEYIFASFDRNGRALFGENSYWHLNATQFGGLEFNRGRPYFNFIKVNSDVLGNILTPLVSRIFDLPQSDNNSDPIDFMNNVKKKRPYYFLPSVKDSRVLLQIRTLESYSFDSEFRKRLNLPLFNKLQFVSTLEQDSISLSKGEVRLLFAVGEVTFNKYYEVVFSNNKEFNIIKKKAALQIHQSNIMTIRSTQAGDFIDEYLITRQQERNKLAFKFSNGSRTLRFTSDWEDPLASILAIYKEGDSYSIYIEGRYYIHLLKTDGKTISAHSKTSINRESSYPGANFSQIFQMSQLNSSKGAIYTDMQRLFGDSIHIITSEDDFVNKKLKYHLAIPAQCALIGHSQIKKRMEVKLHCLGPGNLSSVESALLGE